MPLQPLIIRTCRHTLPNGRHCQGAAVRGRACCRHHLDARTRLHNMARARRCVRLPRLLVAETPRDLAYNQGEVCRVLATQRIDPDTATTMLWALQLSAAVQRAESALLSRSIYRNHNHSVFCHVHISYSAPRTYINRPIQILENTVEEGGGVNANLDLEAAGRKV